jgi:ribonucleotide monophosphatase NagD (HAD superfamily)
LAAADLLAADLPRGTRVLACSGPGVVEALEARGFEVVDALPCEAVVVGWHRTFDFDRLDRASAAIRAGARFVATNTDATYPAANGGLLPGNGSLVAAVATASGRRPEVAGKPEAPTVAMVRRRFGDRGVVVGDRPSTDGALAAALGWPFALVLSAATLSGDEPEDHKADFVGPTLAALADGVIGALRGTVDDQ